MQANDYQNGALRTWQPERTDDTGRKLDLLYHANQLSSEAGEVSGHIAKWAKFDKPLDVDAIADELGDLQWHLSVLADMLGLSLDRIMAGNLDKLERRHPSGNAQVWYRIQAGDYANGTAAGVWVEEDSE